MRKYGSRSCQIVDDNVITAPGVQPLSSHTPFFRAILEHVEVAAIDLDVEVCEPDRVRLGAAWFDPAEPLPTGGADVAAPLGWFAGLRPPLLVTL